MAFCKFEKLSRCFLLLICIGAIFLTLNHHSVQKFSVEMGSHIMKGFLTTKQVVLYNRTYNVTNQRQQHRTDISILQEKTVTTSLYPANDSVENFQIEIRGAYSVIKDYIPAAQKPLFNSTVTLCTQGTYDFLHHVSKLCTRWEGPLSVAVYAPGDDFSSAIHAINRLRQCGPSCIQLNVTWHIIYDTSYSPSDIPATPNETISCEENVTIRSNNFKKDKNLLYPINVARNVARLNSKTRYVFPSDIELYPSVDIVSSFLEMVQMENSSVNPHVYAVPVFEVKTGTEPPQTKSQLVKLMKDGKAIFFHKYICDSCQRFPRRDEWLKVLPANNSLGVFHITKRDKKLASWEPIYICTNDEPLYDERMSWEGKRDKMSQMHQLCLMNYDIYIMDNAFLVHAPGIKSGKSVIEDHNRRSGQVVKNNRVFQNIMRELHKKYPNKNNC